MKITTYIVFCFCLLLFGSFYSPSVSKIKYINEKWCSVNGEGVPDTIRLILNCHTFISIEGKVIDEYYSTEECHTGSERQVQVYYNNENKISKYCFKGGLRDTLKDCWYPGPGYRPIAGGGCGILISELKAFEERLNPKAYLVGEKYSFEYFPSGLIKKVNIYNEQSPKKLIDEILYSYEFY